MGKRLPIITLLPASHEEIVTRYIIEKRPQAITERESFAREPTFEAAVRRAALGLTAQGKVHSHQRRVGARHRWATHLLAHLDLLQAETFEELYRVTESLTIYGINEMTVYDTSYRIGAKLGLEPRLVYLHRGTRDGAVLLGFSKKRETLEPRASCPRHTARSGRVRLRTPSACTRRILRGSSATPKGPATHATPATAHAEGPAFVRSCVHARPAPTGGAASLRTLGG
jgi:hypothetical protein